MKLKFFVILFLTTIDLFSQEIIIFDKELNLPVKYATISYYDSNQLVFSSYCNNYGIFDLNSKYKNNKIEITCTGYYPEEYRFTKINDTIFLKQQIEMLSEVSIGKTNYTTIGYANSKKKSFLNGHTGFEMCTLITNNEGTLKNIKSVLLKVKVDNLVNTAIRLHFYEIRNEKKIPGNEIITKNIIKIFNSKFNGVVVIDVSNENIILPTKGCFVGIEWLETTNKQTNEKQLVGVGIEFNDVLNELSTYFRIIEPNKNWQNTLGFKNHQNKLGYFKFKNYPNLSIGLEVYQ
jgi:hypothetical protein